MFKLLAYIGLLVSVSAEPEGTGHSHWQKQIITKTCQCDFTASIGDKLMQTPTRKVYCQGQQQRVYMGMDTGTENADADGNYLDDEFKKYDADGNRLYFCSDAIKQKGREYCADVVRAGEFLCRNTSYCFAQGEWPSTRRGVFASMDCGDDGMWTGKQSRYCDPMGVWQEPSRDECVSTAAVYCGRGSRDMSCMCEAPQMRYMAEDMSGGFKYMWYDYMDGPEHYAGKGEGDIYYCGGANRGEMCGNNGNWGMDCACPAGTWKVRRNSRSDSAEWYCKDFPTPAAGCGKSKKMSCKDDKWTKKQTCSGYQRPSQTGWVGKWCGEDMDGAMFWKLTDAAQNCNVMEGNWDKSVCAEECGWMDDGKMDDKTSGDAWSSSRRLAWQGDYCRHKDQFDRPHGKQCRKRFTTAECESDTPECEWVTETEAMDAFGDIDRCSRYDGQQTECESINSCNWTCNASNEMAGSCKAKAGMTDPTCRANRDMGSCNGNSKCSWDPNDTSHFNDMCRCRTGPMAEACKTCQANACRMSRMSYECAPEAWFMSTGYKCKGMVDMMECDEWEMTGTEACTQCDGAAPGAFFNMKAESTPVGQRAYSFCAAGQRGGYSQRCLPDGTFSASMDGACVDVNCEGEFGSNWSNTAGNTVAYAACMSHYESGYQERMCHDNGEWGMVTDQCETKDISCGVDKDAWGTWPKTAANTRAKIGCPASYHGERFRDCSEDGHWADHKGGKCVHECYDIVADKVNDPNEEEDAEGNYIGFEDRPRFGLTDQDGFSYLYTCGDGYGKRGTDARVFGLAQDIDRRDLCNDYAVVRDNCPETCNCTLETCGKCTSNCLDQTDDGDKFSFTYKRTDGGDQKVTDMNCLDARQPLWQSRNICETDAVRETCPLTCGACGGGCTDSEDSFHFNGEVHYCHEANDDFCADLGFRANCRESCGETCKEAACPDSNASYLYHITLAGVFDGVMDDVGTTGSLSNCASLTSKFWSDGLQNVVEGEVEGEVCAYTHNSGSDDQKAYYASHPLPSVACAKECAEVNPALYSCKPKCNRYTVGEWVKAIRDNDWEAAQVTGDATGDCHSNLKYIDDTTGQSANKDLMAVPKCSCSSSTTSAKNGDVACEEADFCSGAADGSCFAGEMLCYN